MSMPLRVLCVSVANMHVILSWYLCVGLPVGSIGPIERRKRAVCGYDNPTATP